MPRKPVFTHPDLAKGRVSAFTAGRIDPVLEHKNAVESALEPRGWYSREKSGSEINTAGTGAYQTQEIIVNATGIGTVEYTTPPRGGAYTYSALAVLSPGLSDGSPAIDAICSFPVPHARGTPVRAASVGLFVAAANGIIENDVSNVCPAFTLLFDSKPAVPPANNVGGPPSFTAPQSVAVPRLTLVATAMKFIDVTIAINAILNGASWVGGSNLAMAIQVAAPSTGTSNGITSPGGSGASVNRARLRITT